MLFVPLSTQSLVMETSESSLTYLISWAEGPHCCLPSSLFTSHPHQSHCPAVHSSWLLVMLTTSTPDQVSSCSVTHAKPCCLQSKGQGPQLCFLETLESDPIAAASATDLHKPQLPQLPFSWTHQNFPYSIILLHAWNVPLFYIWLENWHSLSGSTILCKTGCSWQSSGACFEKTHTRSRFLGSAAELRSPNIWKDIWESFRRMKTTKVYDINIYRLLIWRPTLCLT